MTIKSAFQRLASATAALDEALTGVATCIADHPEDGDLVVPVMMSDAADDLCGWLHELSNATRRGLVVADRNPESVVGILETCHLDCDHIARRLLTGLAGDGARAALSQLAIDRPGAWASWAVNVESMTAELWVLTWAVQDAVRQCWGELGARLAGRQIRVEASLIDPLPVAAGRPSSESEETSYGR